MSNLVPRKTYPIPAVVSAIFPGFGQLIKGQFIKAIGFWIAAFLVGFFISWLIALPGALLYIANIADAFLSTDEEKFLS